MSKSNTLLLIFLAILCSTLMAGEAPKTLVAYRGATPTLDGFIQTGEWDDAASITGVHDWQSDTKPACQNTTDLSATMWVKHDGVGLYFAFDVLDDVLYGFDIDRWVHSNNPNANEMNSNGWPWWGDGVEIMMNSTYKWTNTSSSVGDGRSWQVVASTHKSTLHGLEQGGLMAGEPRATAWDIYEGWAASGDMEVAVRLKDKAEGRGYVIEWRINPNPCMQIDATTFVDLSMETKVGLNIEIQDLDEKEKGEGNWSNMHHIDYWTKVGSNRKTDLKSFGTLIIKPEKNPTLVKNDTGKISSFALLHNYPNPFNLSTIIHYYTPSVVQNLNIHIYDRNGRLIRTLFRGHQIQGQHRVEWDGRDSQQHVVASGIYFVRMNSDNDATSLTRKITLIK